MRHGKIFISETHFSLSSGEFNTWFREVSKLEGYCHRLIMPPLVLQILFVLEIGFPQLCHGRKRLSMGAIDGFVSEILSRGTINSRGARHIENIIVGSPCK